MHQHPPAAVPDPIDKFERVLEHSVHFLVLVVCQANLGIDEQLREGVVDFDRGVQDVGYPELDHELFVVGGVAVA